MQNNPAPSPRPIVVQVTVTLTALVFPEAEAGGFSAEVPALPGCYTQGENMEEVKANLCEAAQGWLDSVHDEATAPELASGAA